MPQKQFKDLFKEALAKSETRPSKAAKLLHVSRATIYKWLAGDVLPQPKHARAIEAFFGIPSYAGGGSVQALPEGTQKRRVPFLSTVENSGSGHFLIGKGPPQDWIGMDYDVGEGVVACAVRGDSMEPAFRDGEIIVIDRSLKPHAGDFVVASLPHAEGAECWTFKQYRPRGFVSDEPVYDLVPINPDYETTTIRPSGNQGQIVGVVIEHRRRIPAPAPV